MNPTFDELVQKYFDDEIAEDQLLLLQQHLQSDSAATDRFVENAFLHDRLHGEFQARSAILSIAPAPLPVSDQDRTDPRHLGRSLASSRRRLMTIAAIAASLLIALFLWRGSTDTAIAGVSELKRVIAANSMPTIRAYAIAVESSEPSTAKRKRDESSDRRPIKPPLDRAILYVRGKQDFVLIRKTLSGEDFITGSDGQSSWAVAPDGPVRLSDDLGRFNRDVPGHEFAMPMCQLSDALERLQSVSDLALLPIEYSDGDSEDAEPRRLLVASKKRGQRGPRRVEITYFADSGLMESLRFVDMPYGPERFTVRLSLMPSPSLSEDFFHHQAHHTADREIEIE